MKVKAIDVQTWRGPEIFRSLKFSYFEAMGI
jgi:hypothetical protein